MKFAVCDDDTEYICTLENYLDKINQADLEYDTYQSGEELLRAYEQHQKRYDAIFLDMEMSGVNGIETANRIREMDEHVLIVFATGHTEYMQQSFECAPFRFLVKPIDFCSFENIVKLLFQKLSKQRKVLHITENKTKIRLLCDDIIYCESQAHRLLIHTKAQDYKICKPMDELCKQLDPQQFCRIHKSFVINFHYVQRIQANDVSLYYCDQAVPISRAYKKTVLASYTEFVEKEYAL